MIEITMKMSLRKFLVIMVGTGQFDMKSEAAGYKGLKKRRRKLEGNYRPNLVNERARKTV